MSVIVTYDDSVDPNALERAADGQVVHRFSKIFNGASLVLPGAKVEELAALPGITGVYLDEVLQIDTEASPAFIGAPTVWNALGGQQKAGEGIIVGVLDTGIWPEHPSFADPGPDGIPYPAPPGGPYDCNFGNTAWNPEDAPFACNNKLIGAYEFMDTYKAVVGLDPLEFDSARDSNGHGSHTSSTAAGNAGVEASILGTNFGMISGIAPRAHVIMYRVCGGPTGSCYASDSAAAVEQAILDGVDVLNFSIGGGTNPYSDIVSLAFRSAFENGVFVACSAGNSGPGADTTGHREPWVTTVAASTQSRTFEGYVNVTADNGDTLDLVGVSIGGTAQGELVIGADYGDALCGSVDGVNPFPPGTFTSNQIVVCQRGVTARVEKSANVQAAGGAGVVLYNPGVQTLNADNHFIPTVHIDDVAGAMLLDFMATHTGEMASLEGGVKVFGQGDVMASFSSRGGPRQPLGISKPDISAPGVNILAAQTPYLSFPILGGGGSPGQYFQAIGGTSMSSPHIAGAGALLKHLHPDWTPGQIKSALMMTALTDGVVKEDGVTPADPFDIGSGRVDLNKAGFPGLTISDSVQSFIDLENELWNANYPSLYVPVMAGRLTVQRTVHNETNLPRNWKLTVEAPPDLTITVPKHVQVPRNGDASFDITVDARNVPLGEVRHASIEFKQGNEYLHFPVTIVRQQAAVLMDKVCEPAQLPVGGTTDCTITIENTASTPAEVVVVDQLPDRLSLIPDSVVGAQPEGNNRLVFAGSLMGATPGLRLDDTVPLYGYLPLSAYGFTPIPPPSNADDGAYLISGLDFVYQGVQYTDAIWSVNGTLEIGTASGLAASAANGLMPDATPPNNLLAAWWTDLDLSTGGEWYMGALSDGVNVYDIFEWSNLARFADPSSTASFQIWLARGTNLAWFTYGGFTGDTADGTVGVENANGTVGYTYYYGEGAVGGVPAGDLHVDQNSGSAGETHVITFTATGASRGAWQNCAEMTGDLFYGTSIACAEGTVTK
ncbi:MAG: S8 family serine peptidase [Anaerolineae bacterium]|nr:S8 family serine peptidase [Anaerolineae bacterium]MDX9831983.1 S8 family serine peptidase [Anaerolineae bacterium]